MRDHNPFFIVGFGCFWIAFGTAMLVRFWPEPVALVFGGFLVVLGVVANLSVAEVCSRHSTP